MGTGRFGRKVLVIGWDAADWRVINPLLDQGLMPNLERLVSGGTIGRLATLDPPLSPMLWTSIATGKRPYKHGILGFTETGPDGRSVRPVTNLHRRVKAIWNIIHQEGGRAHVVGWWPSHPAEPIRGTMISNFYQRAGRPINEPWPMQQGTVHPADRSAFFADLRIHPAELTAAHIAPFVPGYAQVDQDKEKGLSTLARILADCSSIHAAATYLLAHEEWDLMCVYYDAIDHFKHAFMKFHPPRRDHIPEREFELYKNVVTAAYQYHDMMLGRLLQLAGDEATVLLLSDHGFHPDHLRPESLPKEPAGPAHEHGPFGIFCLKGPGIKQDTLVHGAGLLDITPTLLTLFDLPVARDMDGRPLLEVYETPVEPRLIASWEHVEGDSGMHPRSKMNSALSDMDQAALQQLVELGYIEDPGQDPEQAAQRTHQENRYYLAKAYADGREFDEALQLLRALHAEAPHQMRFGRELVRILLRMGHTAEARDVLERLRTEVEAAHERERAERSEKEGMDPGPFVPPHSLSILESNILLAEDRAAEALVLLERLALTPGTAERVQARMGKAYMRLGRWSEALAAMERARQRDPQAQQVHHAIGLCLLKLGRPAEAAEALLEAVSLRFNMPFTHYHLGEAHFQAGNDEAALQAFEVCVRMAPEVTRAWLRMAELHKRMGRPDLAAGIHARLQGERQGSVITVVSGLPRSGTSMMMQALVAGGAVPFVDDERPADENNPRGYFEHRGVKALARDNRILAEARGKVVKVVAPLLPFLPPAHRYKVIFMERDLREVLDSQHAMLARAGKVRATDFRVGLRDAFQQQLTTVERWVERHPNVELLRVAHRDVLGRPEEVMRTVNAFLGGGLAEAPMAAAVDPALHRSKG